MGWGVNLPSPSTSPASLVLSKRLAVEDRHNLTRKLDSCKQLKPERNAPSFLGRGQVIPNWNGRAG